MTFPSSSDQRCKDLLDSSITGLERISDHYKIEDLQSNFFKDIVIPISLYLDSFPKRKDPYLICFTGGQGSGKTTMLVSRLIRALAEVNAPEEVLAITFTRKAAEEMRKRVLALLSSKDSAKSIDPELPEIENKIRMKDVEKGWNLNSDPARLSIMTIDSFCSGLLKRASSFSESLYYPTVEEDYKSLYIKVFRDL